MSGRLDGAAAPGAGRSERNSGGRGPARPARFPARYSRAPAPPKQNWLTKRTGPPGQQPGLRTHTVPGPANPSELDSERFGYETAHTGAAPVDRFLRNTFMTRLLILACSERKSPAKGLLPALERYDGPAFRVLRKYLREAEHPAPTVLILSAKYGLITADHAIPDYNCRLTRNAAIGLRAQVSRVAHTAIRGTSWSAVGVCAGKDYRLALDGLAELLPRGIQLTWIEGGQGVRLANLKRWLLVPQKNRR